MAFGSSPRNPCTSIRFSRHKRNGRHSVSAVLDLSAKRARVAAPLQTMTESRIKHTWCGKMSVPSESLISKAYVNAGHQPS